MDFVRERLQQAGNADSSTLKKICEELCDECLAEDPLQSEGTVGGQNAYFVCICRLLFTL